MDEGNTQTTPKIFDFNPSVFATIQPVIPSVIGFDATRGMASGGSNYRPLNQSFVDEEVDFALDLSLSDLPQPNDLQTPAPITPYDDYGEIPEGINMVTDGSSSSPESNWAPKTLYFLRDTSVKCRLEYPGTSPKYQDMEIHFDGRVFRALTSVTEAVLSKLERSGRKNGWGQWYYCDDEDGTETLRLIDDHPYFAGRVKDRRQAGMDTGKKSGNVAKSRSVQKKHKNKQRKHARSKPRSPSPVAEASSTMLTQAQSTMLVSLSRDPVTPATNNGKRSSISSGSVPSKRQALDLWEQQQQQLQQQEPLFFWDNSADTSAVPSSEDSPLTSGLLTPVPQDEYAEGQVPMSSGMWLFDSELPGVRVERVL